MAGATRSLILSRHPLRPTLPIAATFIPPPALEIDRVEVPLRRTLDDLPPGVVPRTVTGAVPRLRAVVPAHRAAQVLALGRQHHELPRGVAVRGDLVAALHHQRSLAGRDV